MADQPASAVQCECAQRGMTGGKAHPLCPVHGVRDGAQTAGFTVWCYDECHSICQFAANKNDGYTSCKCECHPVTQKSPPHSRREARE